MYSITLHMYFVYVPSWSCIGIWAVVYADFHNTITLVVLLLQ